jgi:hypothetical protein
MLSGVVVERMSPSRPIPAAKLGPPPPKPKPVEPRCQVPGCSNKAKPRRPVCGGHRLDELPADVLTAYRAEQAARPREKPGPKARSAA